LEAGSLTANGGRDDPVGDRVAPQAFARPGKEGRHARQIPFLPPRPRHGSWLFRAVHRLGGTSYAVATGSIDSREIKNNTVRSGDIRNNTVRGKDVRTETLRSSDVADRSLLARDFAAGQVPAGPRGPAGPAGQNGFGLLTYPINGGTLANGATAAVITDRPRGTFATGGDTFARNAANNDVTNQVLISQGFNFGTGTIGWAATVTNNTGGDVTVGVEAACANADTVSIASKRPRLRRYPWLLL